MTELKDACVQVLQTALVGLPTYNGSPAIFAADKVPGDCPRPYATVYGPVTALAFDTKTGPTGSEDPEAGAGHNIGLDVNVYADADGDPATVDGFAWAAQRAFNRKPSAVNAFLTAAPWRVMMVRAVAPIVAPTDDSVYGRSVSVTVILRPR